MVRNDAEINGFVSFESFKIQFFVWRNCLRKSGACQTVKGKNSFEFRDELKETDPALHKTHYRRWQKASDVGTKIMFANPEIEPGSVWWFTWKPQSRGCPAWPWLQQAGS